ncbi:MAG: hypothetical protein Fur0035_05070 [Anaerolineales bacterium]
MKKQLTTDDHQPTTDKDFLRLQVQDLPYFRALLRAVESSYYQEIDLPAPTLDVGCGDGHFTQLTFDRPLEVGLDPWEGPIREAGTRGVYRLLTRADGGDMPYPAEYFASAISNSVLEHIPQVEAVLAETARVLKPGAIFAFCVPNDRFNPTLSVARALERLGLRGPAGAYRKFFTVISRHVHMDDSQTWQARLQKAGFRLEKHWNYFPPRAQAVLEWGHYFGLPALISRKLFGRWILVKSDWNLGWLVSLLRPYADNSPAPDGVYSFYIARRM